LEPRSFSALIRRRVKLGRDKELSVESHQAAVTTAHSAVG